MKLKNMLKVASIALVLSVAFTSCNKDKNRVEDFNYTVNTGQLNAAWAYAGDHASNVTADIKLEGQKEGTMITVTINNSVNGETYNVHAHDAAEATSTPNGTPYNEAPNAGVFVKQISGNGSAASASFLSTMSVTELTETYEGFLVVHDPLQTMSTTDPTTFIILGSFAR